MTEAKAKVCKDCLAEDPTGRQAKRRNAQFPGPRCTPHHHAEKRARRLRAANYRTQKTYSISPEDYERILAAQGGTCAGCPRNGRTKRLAVDHDHSCCIGPTSCGKCVRMLVCSTCNDVLAHFRDSSASLRKLADALDHWPSQRAGVTQGRVGIRRR